MTVQGCPLQIVYYWLERRYWLNFVGESLVHSSWVYHFEEEGHSMNTRYSEMAVEAVCLLETGNIHPERFPLMI